MVTGLLGGLWLLMTTFRSLETRLNQRISEIKEDVRASEARQMEELRGVKAELKAMGNKLDRVLESLPAAKP